MSRLRGQWQRGQETLQAILAVSFMLLPVLLGIVELGGLIHLWIGQESAATAGARAAGERGEDDAFVRARIALSLRASGIAATSDDSWTQFDQTVAHTPVPAAGQKNP